jgi:hypothetical protein
MNSTLLYGSCVSLFAYIQGNNDQAANINMTAPVRVDMFPSTGSSHNTTLIMHLYWPPKHQFNPPPPPPPIKHVQWSCLNTGMQLWRGLEVLWMIATSMNKFWHWRKPLGHPLGIINSKDTVSFLWFAVLLATIRPMSVRIVLMKSCYDLINID